MDEELKNGLKNLAKAQRVFESSYMKNVGGAIDVNQEIEEIQYINANLKKKLKRVQINALVGIVCTVIALLYAIVTYKPPVIITPEPTESIIEEPITQEISTVNLYMKSNIPVLDLNDLSVVDLLDFCADYDFVSYAGDAYWNLNDVFVDQDGNTLPNIEVYTCDNLEEIIQKAEKSYSYINDKFYQEYKQNQLPVDAVYDDGMINKHGFFSLDTIRNNSVTDDQYVTQADDVITFEFTFYGSVDESDVKKTVEETLRGKNLDDSVIGEIHIGLKNISKKLVFNDVSDYYTDIFVDDTGNTVCVIDDMSEIPETITTYRVTITNVVYNALAIAYSSDVVD